MRNPPMAALWHASYSAVVRSAFATVPVYRELWAVHGRTEPVVVHGRTGVAGGAITRDIAVRTMVDLVPIAADRAAIDPLRGLGPVLARTRRARPGTLVVALKPGAGALVGLPRHVRGDVLDPELLSGGEASAAAAGVAQARRRHSVLVVGAEDDLRRLVDLLPGDGGHPVDEVPERHLDGLDGGAGVIYDRLFGYLGALLPCGRWHLDWPRVYARRTSAGLAFTLLRQRSPRLVDVVLADGAVEFCVRHGTPVVAT